jgi:RHS repeat-associated protein
MNVVYPVSSAITLKYDRLNRLTNMVDAVGMSAYSYDQVGQLLSEDGPWSSDTVSYTYANRLRTGLSVAAPNASAWTQSYIYDDMRRLTNVTSPAGVFGYDYGYDPYYGYVTSPASLVRKLTLPNSAYITNYYDGNARLLGTYLRNSGDTNLDTQDCVYNLGNQRTQQVFTAANFINYTYDSIGQLKTAKGKEAGGTTNRWQEQFGYAYDAAGNLNWRTNNTLLQAFNVNNLNQLSTINSTGRLTVAGTTTSPATNVTVNTSNAFVYADAMFASTNQPWVNGNNTYTAIAKDSYGRKDTNIISVSLLATNTYAYDLNGNMITNGTRVLDYDDENQLIRITRPSAWKSEFTYDGKMRRRIRREYTWNGSWVLTNEVRYVYDGNLVIQERDANNLPQVTYTRGRDLSGSLEGAGGIGGLLARTDNGQLIGGSSSATALYHADGNGNVTCLIYMNQLIAAKYEYDPYGNNLSQSGPLADANLYRFSSKEFHPNSGLVYYLYRLYDSSLQRWPNRDPINELGFKVLIHRTAGLNRRLERDLYQFVGNSPIRHWDYLGLDNPGCDPPGDKAIKLCPDQKDCILRCCAEHDQCYYDNDCSWWSWILEDTPECMGCNATVATCTIMCKAIKALTQATTEQQRFHALDKAAKESFVVGKIEDARKYSNELMTLALKFKEDWNYGNAMQDANVVLGRIAVREGHIDEAKKRLIEAGKSPGSPVMNSFGPNMSLAKDLLQNGQKDVVLEYLELCRKFWSGDFGKTDKWEGEIKAGKIPNFGANLVY